MRDFLYGLAFTLATIGSYVGAVVGIALGIGALA